MFKNRSHAATAKAIMINTASQYPIDDGLNDDLRRTHQGWGLTAIGRTYLLRDNFPIIVDETDVLDLDPVTTTIPDYVEYQVSVPEDTPALRVTLSYLDPQGDPAVQARHTVNDLDLKVTAPNGTTHYYGNCGLREGNWSSSVCSDANHPFVSDLTTQVIDTVENVFIETTTPGTWTIRIDAVEINEDARPIETPTVDDIDFALVVSLESDCNQNGFSDADDILGGTSEDCNDNGVPDDCEGFDQGACCLPDGTCGLYLDKCCTDEGGTFQGAGTNCKPMRTCCVGDGSCLSTSPTCCANIGGQSQPRETPACDFGTGACCLPPFGCCVEEVTQSWCQSAGGAYHPLDDCTFAFPCEGTQGPSQWP